jgi:hypothetical protein
MSEMSEPSEAARAFNTALDARKCLHAQLGEARDPWNCAGCTMEEFDRHARALVEQEQEARRHSLAQEMGCSVQDAVGVLERRFDKKELRELLKAFSGDDALCPFCGERYYVVQDDLCAVHARQE